MKQEIQTRLTSAPTALRRSFPSGEQLPSHLKCGDNVTCPPCSSWPGNDPDGCSLESGGTAWIQTSIIITWTRRKVNTDSQCMKALAMKDERAQQDFLANDSLTHCLTYRIYSNKRRPRIRAAVLNKLAQFFSSKAKFCSSKWLFYR